MQLVFMSDTIPFRDIAIEHRADQLEYVYIMASGATISIVSIGACLLNILSPWLNVAFCHTWYLG